MSQNGNGIKVQAWRSCDHLLVEVPTFVQIKCKKTICFIGNGSNPEVVQNSTAVLIKRDLFVICKLQLPTDDN